MVIARGVRRAHRSRATVTALTGGRTGVEQRVGGRAQRRAGRHDVVDEDDPAAGDRAPRAAA